MYSMAPFITNVFHKKPVHLTYFVTNRCNSKCRTCFNWKLLNQKENELNLGEVTKFSKRYGRIMWLLLSGGEPFLRNDLVEICKIFYDHNKPVNITIPTNGILSNKIFEDTKKIADYCKNSRITLKLSLDGLNETHNYIRGIDCFDKVIRTYSLLKTLKNGNLEISFNTVICKSNLNELDQIFNFIKEKKDSFTFSLARGETPESEKVDINDVEKFIQKIIGYISNKKGKDFFDKVKLKQDIIQKKLIINTLKYKKRIIPCYAGKINLVLMANGDVYPCELTKVKLGNIKNFGYDIHKLMNSNKETLKSFYNLTCFCSHECYFMTNVLFNPSVWRYAIKGEENNLMEKLK